MPHRNQIIVALALLLITSAVRPALSAPPFDLTDDGRTFVYRARPGESPSLVAESFGIPDDHLGEFLAANGITDPTRVPLGFEYRIPNPLGPRLTELAGEVETLKRTVAARTTQTTQLERALEELKVKATLASEKERRLGALEARWPIAITALVLALLGLVAAVWMARLALGRLGGAERRAAALAHELEDRRRAALAERQEAGHRIIELESRVRQLECQPRVVGGRG